MPTKNYRDFAGRRRLQCASLWHVRDALVCQYARLVAQAKGAVLPILPCAGARMGE